MPRHEEQPRAIKDLRAYVYDCCEAIAKGDASKSIAAILWAVIQDRLSEAVAARDEYARALERIIDTEDFDVYEVGPKVRTIARVALADPVPKPLSDSEEATG